MRCAGCNGTGFVPAANEASNDRVERIVARFCARPTGNNSLTRQPDRLRIAVRLLLQGRGIRETALEIGAHRDTIGRLARRLRVVGERPPDCDCGRPVMHRGDCMPRRLRKGRS